MWHETRIFLRQGTITLALTQEIYPSLVVDNVVKILTFQQNHLVVGETRDTISPYRGIVAQTAKDFVSLGCIIAMHIAFEGYYRHREISLRTKPSSPETSTRLRKCSILKVPHITFLPNRHETSNAGRHYMEDVASTTLADSGLIPE